MKNRFAFPVLLFLLLWLPPTEGESRNKEDLPACASIPILLYHRFGPVVADCMTVPTPLFESHLRFLHENGYTVIPLRELADGYFRRSLTPSTRWVAICADDGHKSVYTDFFPLLKKYRIPVTIFLYPSAISNASYAMTWNQLREMQATGLVDFQSHTFWHPNFKVEKKRLNPAEYEKFLEMQLKKSRETLEKELHVKVDMLAWPFGIYDEDLIHQAARVGYVAAFSIKRRSTSKSDNPLALPRYLITNTDRFSGYLF